MNHRLAALAGAAALMTATGALAADAPATHLGPPDWAAVKAHTDRAHRIGGAMWKEAADYACAIGQHTNSPDAAAIEPFKAFDNLVILGDRETSIYAITTPEGVILIDSGYAAKADTVLLAGLAKAGIDPAQVKLVLITHGHADHFGGAAALQDRGARIAVSAKDWDMIAAARVPTGAKALRRDMVLEDGVPVTLGGVSVTPVAIPGHTPGAMSFIFPVRDRGRTHRVGLIGSMMLRTSQLPPETIIQGVASLERLSGIARRAGVDVEFTTHPLFDHMWDKAEALKARGPDAPNPFVVGTQNYGRLIGAFTECFRGVLARKGVKPAG